MRINTSHQAIAFRLGGAQQMRITLLVCAHNILTKFDCQLREPFTGNQNKQTKSINLSIKMSMQTLNNCCSTNNTNKTALKPTDDLGTQGQVNGVITALTAVL